MSKKTNDALRAAYVSKIAELLKNADEEVLVTNSNELCIPCVDSEGEDQYIVLTIKVPTGSRDGDPYDGYAAAEDYKIKCELNEEKAKITAEKKAAKIKRDEAARAAKAAAKAEREAAKENANG